MRYIAASLLILMLNSCGGTFQFDVISHKLTYKTPVLIQPWK